MESENKNNPKDSENTPAIQRGEWNVKEIVEEGANQHSDEVVRQVLREDDPKEQADGQDIAGSVDSDDTPQGREENKHNEGVKK